MSRQVAPADELLVRSGTGDRLAFAAFYDETSSRVFSVVRRVLRDHAQSEEVTQDVYLEVWKTAARYDPDQAGSVTWILTIAHRRAVDRVRASESSRQRDLKIGIRDIDREFDHVSEHVEINSEFDRARRALTSLTDLQRQAVSLIYFDGYTQSELAEKMGIPIGTVKTRVRDGLTRMRKEMALTA